MALHPPPTPQAAYYDLVLRRPAMFAASSSSRAARNFLEEFETYITNTYPLDQKALQREFFSFLDGRACEWYMRDIANSPKAQEYKLMKQEFLKNFGKSYNLLNQTCVLSTVFTLKILYNVWLCFKGIFRINNLLLLPLLIL